METTQPNYGGTIRRGQLANEKGYTNLSNNVLELGFATSQEYEQFSYDFTGFFKLQGLGSLVRELLGAKLKAAGWKQANSLEEEALRLGLHKVFGLSEESFVEWMVLGVLPDEAEDLGEVDDLEFLARARPAKPSEPFSFRPGHSPKKEGEITTSSRESAYTSKLLHNEIQTALYDKLRLDYGDDCVGTEVPTGDGTSIDVVVSTDAFCWFYEIKTASTAKLCIRQAIPQLLEYAYWQGDTDKVDKLIIVSQNEITPEAELYLQLLRDAFRLPLYYERHEA